MWSLGRKVGKASTCQLTSDIGGRAVNEMVRMDALERRLIATILAEHECGGTALLFVARRLEFHWAS
jgi:hypothetical protein